MFVLVVGHNHEVPNCQQEDGDSANALTDFRFPFVPYL